MTTDFILLWFLLCKLYYSEHLPGTVKRRQKELKILEHSKQEAFPLNICSAISHINIFQPHTPGAPGLRCSVIWINRACTGVTEGNN